MIRTTGRILLSVRTNEVGVRERLDYTWQGGDVVAISRTIFDHTFERMPGL